MSKHGEVVGGRRSRTLEIWRAMMRRCYDQKQAAYARYGGLGVKVCDRWHNFANFLEDMGRPPAGMSIDRIDTFGDYSRDNCRWATVSEQARNKRDTIKIDGVSLVDWCERLQVNYYTAYDRFKAGLPIDLVFCRERLPRNALRDANVRVARDR